MIISSRKFINAVTLGALLSLAVPAAHAGAEEDYTEGNKIYLTGDLIGAMPKLRLAADAGHAAAQAMLANILEQSDDRVEAIKYYRKAAEHGNAEGQFGYAALLAAGEGAPKDVIEARRWLDTAAKQGHKMAINELAIAYLRGTLDIPEAERKGPVALQWVQLSAENGFIPAMDAMVAAYRNGEFGLKADLKTAALWTDKINKLRGVRQTGRRNRSKE